MLAIRNRASPSAPPPHSGGQGVRVKAAMPTHAGGTIAVHAGGRSAVTLDGREFYSPARLSFHIRVRQHVVADHRRQITIRSDEPTERAHRRTERIELLDCQAVLVVGAPEIDEVITQ